MRNKILIGNWKMNMNLEKTIQFVKAVDGIKKDNLIHGVATPTIYLNDAKNHAQEIVVAAQNCFFEESGAYTGEISPTMLNDINIGWCIVGHSERREYFGETDTIVNKKLKALLAHQIRPILCCGETLEEYENKQTETKVTNQLQKAFANISANDALKIVIAYEPIWAIGTGKTATADIAENVCAFIRGEIAKLYSFEIAEQILIQYGGSVKPNNIQQIMSQPNIDGALVGGASLEINSYQELIKNI